MADVLFICSGNYYRSRFAEAYFNHCAASSGFSGRAESRGFRLHPANLGPISSHTLVGLSRLGIVLPEPLRSPLTLSPADFARFGTIVAVKEAEHRPLMQAFFPDFVDRIEYWQIDDVDCAAPVDALSQLQARVDELLKRLALPRPADA